MAPFTVYAWLSLDYGKTYVENQDVAPDAPTTDPNPNMLLQLAACSSPPPKRERRVVALEEAVVAAEDLRERNEKAQRRIGEAEKRIQISKSREEDSVLH
eukprot:SAG25_NODE_2070_length_1987_cov_1.408369_1_plen_100_part_00